MDVQVPNGVVDIAVKDEEEAVEVAKKYSMRCDKNRIPCISTWTKKQAKAIKTN